MPMWEVLIISFIPLYTTLLFGAMDYLIWKKRNTSDNPPQSNDTSQTDKGIPKRYYSPDFRLYRFAALLGIIVVAFYLAGRILPLLLTNSITWQDIVLRLGIMAGAITILSIIVKLIRGE